ncbi:HNH endonuclease signature motif containing protein [Microbacterium neungamense]|uniref:HNH endonuclease signature motif containing protein n=1 Tax=Microbacterium neungamense TaxID=2810535 RepID=UPI00217E9657|nr:HNH endonuclease signature motif containing protein [Microbacterium neungamense]UWF76609.1 DUF222 domain-containing protein [Microbacterium neungamense]
MNKELLDVSADKAAALERLVCSVGEIEGVLTRLQAMRDGFLAVGAQLAVEIAAEAEHPDGGDMSIRSLTAELGALLRVSDRTVQRRMSDASALVTLFPSVWEAQGEGRINAGHARVIADAGSGLTEASDRAAFAALALEVAEHESPNRLRKIAARLAERFQPRSIEERHREQRARRGVWVKDGADGCAELGMSGPAALVHGMFDRLTRMAQTVKAENARAARDLARAAGEDPERELRASDDRTLGQLRADLLADLVLTGTPAGHDTPEGLLAGITAQVEITVPAMTLMGCDLTAVRAAAGAFLAGTGRAPVSAGVGSSVWTGGRLPPAMLNGRSPIDLRTARMLAGAASGWDRVLTDPFTGAMLAVDRYRPGADLKRHLKARDQRCRFVACGYPARLCDLDHHQDAALGGATRADNLGDFCRRHHVLKHCAPWHVRQLPGGLMEWTSPTGRIYIDQPPPQNTVTFTPPDAPGGVSRTPDLWGPLEQRQTALAPF